MLANLGPAALELELLQSTLAISTLKGDKEKCAYSECVLITSFAKNHLKNMRVQELMQSHTLES